MKDSELLELAAKAIGCTIRGKANNEYYNLHEADDTHYYWNPLTDDGDALRLMVKLNLLVQFNARHIFVFDDKGTQQLAFLGKKNDPYAATRRAIVRAAAEIGRATI